MRAQCDKIKIFEDNYTTFEEASRDKHNKDLGYMTDSEVQVIDFDKVKDSYIKDMGLSYRPCSTDALYFGKDDKIYFVEFKNGVMNKAEVFHVYNKIYDSLLMFNDIIKENVSFCRDNVIFILVYNESKNSCREDSVKKEDSSKAVIAKYFHAKAKKKYVRFDLDRFKKLYFRDVFTYTEKEFEEAFLAGLE